MGRIGYCAPDRSTVLDNAKHKCVALEIDIGPPTQLRALVTHGRRKSASPSRCRLRYICKTFHALPITRRPILRQSTSATTATPCNILDAGCIDSPRDINSGGAIDHIPQTKVAGRRYLGIESIRKATWLLTPLSFRCSASHRAYRPHSGSETPSKIHSPRTIDQLLLARRDWRPLRLTQIRTLWVWQWH